MSLLRPTHSRPRPAWVHSLPTALILMAPFDLLASLAMDIYLPVIPAMPEALGTSPAMIQLSLSLYLLGLGLGQILFGPLSDIVGRRPVLLGGAALFALSSALMALATSAPFFVALRLAQALGASAMLVTTFATVRDVYADRPESRYIYGLFGSMLSFVPALAPILGTAMAALAGWRAIFWLLAGLSLLPLAHAALRWPETRPASRKGQRSPWPILASGEFWLYTLAYGTAMGTFFVFFSVSPRILVHKAGYTPLQFSLAFATAALAMVATSQWLRRFAQGWSIDGSIRRGLALLLAGAAVLASTTALCPPSFASVILPMWVMSAGIVCIASATANGALAPFGDRAGLAVALYFAGQSVVVSALGTGAILLFNGATAWPLVLFPAVCASALLAVFTLRRR